MKYISEGRYALRFYIHVLARTLARFFKSAKNNYRTEEYVRREYDEVYSRISEREKFERSMYRLQYVISHGRYCLYPLVEYKKFLIRAFSSLINSYQIRSIVELGSGRGLNILALAVLNPELRMLRGIELSRRGVDIARDLLAHPPLSILSHITEYPAEIVLERLRHRDIEFVEGTIRSLPYADRAFDAVFSNSVVEQFPRDYLTVFREAARVASTITFFSEPFFEAEKNIFRHLHIKNLDYFHESYHEVKKAGLEILRFEVLPVQKFAFTTGLLVCRPKRENSKELGNSS